MWFRVELPQAASVTEVQFDSMAAMGGRGGGGRGATGPPPLVGYPRAYSVQVSLDGKKWSKPVATGRGEGAHTTIVFPSAQAKFVRITQTDNIPDAPWSIRSLRVYEARSSAGTR